MRYEFCGLVKKEYLLSIIDPFHEPFTIMDDMCFAGQRYSQGVYTVGYTTVHDVYGLFLETRKLNKDPCLYLNTYQCNNIKCTSCEEYSARTEDNILPGSIICGSCDDTDEVLGYSKQLASSLFEQATIMKLIPRWRWKCQT